MAQAKRWLNLVFQGGGVRGIAYAGVLAKMPDHCDIHSVGGTSAGSIVACFGHRFCRVDRGSIVDDHRLAQ